MTNEQIAGECVAASFEAKKDPKFARMTHYDCATQHLLEVCKVEYDDPAFNPIRAIIVETLDGMNVPRV